MQILESFFSLFQSFYMRACSSPSCHFCKLCENNNNRATMYIIKTLMENFLIKMVVSLFIVHSLVKCDKNNEQRFQFPEFDYKETSKNVSDDNLSFIQQTKSNRFFHSTQFHKLNVQELSYREFESACDQSANCKELPLDSIQRRRCVMECISPSCYQDIYRFDEVLCTEKSININWSNKFSQNCFSWKKVKSMYDWYHSKDASYNVQVDHGIVKLIFIVVN